MCSLATRLLGSSPARPPFGEHSPQLQSIFTFFPPFREVNSLTGMEKKAYLIEMLFKHLTFGQCFIILIKYEYLIIPLSFKIEFHLYIFCHRNNVLLYTFAWILDSFP